MQEHDGCGGFFTWKLREFRDRCVVTFHIRVACRPQDRNCKLRTNRRPGAAVTGLRGYLDAAQSAAEKSGVTVRPMFDFDQPLLIAGLLLGVSSSLHCFGMCSGIAASLHFAAELDPHRPTRSLLTTTLLINAGRISGYMIVGAIVGGLGSSVFGAFDHATAHAILRWAAAVALGWVGLSMLDVLPLPAGLYRIASHVSRFMDAAARATRLPQTAGLVLSGTAWGFLPCAMVYAALFYAMFSGSWLGGTVVMSGFGLATLPVMIGTGLGLPLLRRRATSARLRTAVGVAILGVGIVSAGISPAAFAAWCRSW
jgi:sulfite exporter TauE/SafE